MFPSGSGNAIPGRPMAASPDHTPGSSADRSSPGEAASPDVEASWNGLLAEESAPSASPSARLITSWTSD